MPRIRTCSSPSGKGGVPTRSLSSAAARLRGSALLMTSAGQPRRTVRQPWRLSGRPATRSSNGYGATCPTRSPELGGRTRRRRGHVSPAPAPSPPRWSSGTIGASVGYYAAAYVNGVRSTYRAAGRPAAGRMRALTRQRRSRSAASPSSSVPPRSIDSMLIRRPWRSTSGPFLFGNIAVGWIFGSLVADVAFYVMAIFSYERFTGLLRPARTRRRIADRSGSRSGLSATTRRHRVTSLTTWGGAAVAMGPGENRKKIVEWTRRICRARSRAGWVSSAARQASLADGVLRRAWWQARSAPRSATTRRPTSTGCAGCTRSLQRSGVGHCGSRSPTSSHCAASQSNSGPPS